MWPAIQNQITEVIGTGGVGGMNFFHKILFLISEYGPAYLHGAGTTLMIAIISTIVGCFIGLGVGIVQTIPVAKKDNLLKKLFVYLCRFLTSVYVEIFRGTPMMVQAVFVYFGIPVVWGVFLPVLPTALLVVSINTGAYMAETVRGGILSIDPGQTEGAKAIGMDHVQTMLHVILPQTLRNIMPQIGNNLVINIKDTCVLSTIGVGELFFAHTQVAGARYTFFESATIIMIVYFTMTIIFSRLLRFIEKKMDGKDGYDLATSDTLAHTTGLYSYPGKGSNFDERHPEDALEMNPDALAKKKKGRDT